MTLTLHKRLVPKPRVYHESPWAPPCPEDRFIHALGGSEYALNLKIEEWGETGLVDLDVRYHTSKHHIAKELAAMSVQKLKRVMRNKLQRTLPHNIEGTKGQPMKHLKRASAILRTLRDEHGVHLQMTIHPLQRWTNCDIAPPTEDFVTLWAKDHVFRGVAINVVRNNKMNWSDLLTSVKAKQHQLQSTLIRPFRRQLAKRRMSVTVALTISNLTIADQQKLLHQPKWHICSVAMLRQLNELKSVAKKIKEAGRTPARDIINPRRSEMVDDKREWNAAIHCFIRAGGVTPTSRRGIRQLVKDLHNRQSNAYKLVNRHQETPVWVLNEPLPPLPSLGNIDIRLFQKQKDWIDEGLAMNHCIGMYAGQKGIFAHIERANDKATLFVGTDGRFQCYAERNSINPLTRDIVDRWVPTLKEWLTDDKLVEMRTPLPEPSVPAYE